MVDSLCVPGPLRVCLEMKAPKGIESEALAIARTEAAQLPLVKRLGVFVRDSDCIYLPHPFCELCVAQFRSFANEYRPTSASSDHCVAALNYRSRVALLRFHYFQLKPKTRKLKCLGN